MGNYLLLKNLIKKTDGRMDDLVLIMGGLDELCRDIAKSKRLGCKHKKRFLELADTCKSFVESAAAGCQQGNVASILARRARNNGILMLNGLMDVFYDICDDASVDLEAAG